MDFRHDGLQSDRLAFVSYANLAPAFFMNVIDAGLRNIVNLPVIADNALGQSHVFQPWQGLVKLIFLPDVFAHGSVGVVAEEPTLRMLLNRGEIFGEERDMGE